MAFPSEFLDGLRSRVDLASVIGKRVRLTRRGRDLLGLCPFHREKTPSFTVFADHYHCFGCGAHGSVFDFVMQSEGVGFRDAVERVAAEVGMEMPAEDDAGRETARRRRDLHEVAEAAASYFERMLRMPEGEDALAYLRRRGLDDALIATFRLGYAPDARDGLRTHLARGGVSDDQMADVGLIVRPEAGPRPPYDRFRGRVMFPITDRRGRVIAFGGRLLGGGEPKYLNSPETSLFAKGRLLYGLAHAAAAAREAGTIIVAEGYMDVIALFRSGYRHAVAPLGTALTEHQIAALWRMTAEPIILFDPDAAGQRAALRAAERALPLLKPGLGIKFAFVETETKDDPDGIVRRYPPQFLRSALAGASSLSELLFWAETQGRAIRTAEERAALEARLQARAGAVPDETFRIHLLRSFREQSWQLLRKGRGPGGSSGRMATMAAATPRQAPSDVVAEPTQSSADVAWQREAILLAVVIENTAVLDHVGERLGSVAFLDPALDRLRQEVLHLTASGSGVDSTELEGQLRTGGHSPTIDAVLSPQTWRHAFFARRGVNLQTAIEGWEETYARYTRDRMRVEIESEKRRIADSLQRRCGDGPGRQLDHSTDSQYGYLEALKRHEHGVAGERDGGDSGDDAGVGRSHPGNV